MKGNTAYTDLPAKDRLGMLNQMVRDLEVKHFQMFTQAELNRAIALMHKGKDNTKFRSANEQSSKDENEAETLANSLVTLRKKRDQLAALVEADAVDEGEPDAASDDELSQPDLKPVD